MEKKILLAEKIETEEDLKKYLKRLNLDDAMADQLIQRVQTLGKPSKPKKDPSASLSWLDEVKI